MTEVSLIAIVVISALSFGSVEPWAIAVIGMLTASAFILFVYSNGIKMGRQPVKGIYRSGALLFAYPVFQLLPLPLFIISIIQPMTKEVVTVSPDAAPLFHSISIYPYATEIGLLKLIIFLMIFSMTAFGISVRENIMGIIKALSIFGFILSIFGIIQLAAWNGKIYWFRELSQGGAPFGPFVNKNHFAGFIGMIIPLTLGIALMSDSMEKKIRYGFLSVVMGIALFFSLSRGGIISFFSGILVFSFIIFAKGRAMKRLLPVFLFTFTLSLYLLYLGISPVIDRFVKSDLSMESRFVAWQGILPAIWDFSIFGSGLGTFQHIYKAYKPFGLTQFWDHAHNDYLELFLEFGVIGIIIFALFLYSVLKIIVKGEYRDREIYLKAGFLSSITTIAVHSIMDFNLHIPSNAILFFLIMGIAVSYNIRRQNWAS